jgi:DNA-binding LacI/PurR family transcriptional regulator
LKTKALTRSGKLASELRRQIVSGRFGPGERLPTFQDIETNYRVSRGVAQMAVGRLKADGFVSSDARQGLYVVSDPPHLRRYGLIFSVAHGDPAWSPFDDVLVRESRLAQRADLAQDFDIFAGTSDSRGSAKVVERLAREVLSDRLAGLILTPGTFDIAQQAPFNEPALPKVYVYQRMTESGPTVTGDGESLVDRSLEWLAAKGCRRVAVIRVKDAYTWIGPGHFQKHGLMFKPQWLQVVGRGELTVLSTLIPLLMDYPPGERPDGLFVLDDSLVDATVSAIVATGLQIGQDLQMVNHTNWPLRSPSMLPVRRIGFHIGHILSRCLAVIDAQRRGETPPARQTVPALFEDEVELTQNKPTWQ